MTRSFSRMLSAENSSKLSAQSPAWSRKALPAATSASERSSERDSPANTSGGYVATVLSARCSPSASGHSGCWRARSCCHDEGVHASVMRRAYWRVIPPSGPIGEPEREPGGIVLDGRDRSRPDLGGSRGSDGSDGEDALGVVAQADDGPADQPAGRLGGDAEALADLTEALALTVEEPEAGLDGVASTRVERAEELVEQVAVDHRHHGVLGGAVAVGHEVAERGVTIVADRLVE